MEFDGRSDGDGNAKRKPAFACVSSLLQLDRTSSLRHHLHLQTSSFPAKIACLSVFAASAIQMQAHMLCSRVT